MKRQRGRSRRSGGGGNNPNRHFESNGPDVKIRGSAQQVLDKYLQYARDAQTSGDRVMSEAYFQHAEHYQRLLSAMQPKEKPKRDRDDQAPETSDEAEAKSAEETPAEAEAAEAEGAPEKPARGRPRGRRKDRDEEAAEQQDAGADPLKVIDSDDGAEEEAPKPRRRRTYKKRETTDAEAVASDDDGVMKTLSRGRPKAAEASEGDEGQDSPASAAE